MLTRWRRGVARLDRWAHALENFSIVLLLSVLIALSSSQIVLRNVFSTSLAWGDELVRLLVLWLALCGAIAASRDGRQIRIDALSRLLPPRWARLPDAVSAAFTAAVCGLLSWHSARFVLDSRAYGDLLLGNQPAWIPELILPVGFAAMACRYSIRTASILAGRT